jgi:hypothetical protein
MWKFHRVDQGFWDSMENKRDYLDWLFKELKLSKMEDWYTVKMSDFRVLHGGGLLTRYSNRPMDLITAVYTDHEWHLSRFWGYPVDDKSGGTKIPKK